MTLRVYRFSTGNVRGKLGIVQLGNELSALDSASFLEREADDCSINLGHRSNRFESFNCADRFEFVGNLLHFYSGDLNRHGGHGEFPA